MPKEHLSFGRSGEEEAVKLLKGHGYKIILRNYKNKLGEIDIIAYDKGILCFIEVKARHSDRFGLPQEAISRPKQRQISKVALIYLKENNLLDKKARFDVVSAIYLEGSPKLGLLKNAFELEESFSY